jgi:hypothetical protein
MVHSYAALLSLIVTRDGAGHSPARLPSVITGESRSFHIFYKIGPADGGTNEKNPAQREAMADSAKQSQSPAVAGGHCPPDEAESLSCKTNPICGGQHNEIPAGRDVGTSSAKQSQFPGADASLPSALLGHET